MSPANKKAKSSRHTPRPDVRETLLNAAEQVIRNEGYAAATVRRICSQAGMRHQAVSYHFGSQEDLLLALLHRSMEQHRRRLKVALASDRPLRSMWEFVSNPDFAKIGLEFLVMANHNETIRKELAKNARKIRELETKAITKYLNDMSIEPRISPRVVSILTTALARLLMQESTLGIHTGHKEIEALVELSMRDLESRLDPDT